jgi:Dual specificity phosphatase, catalytic domain
MYIDLSWVTPCLAVGAYVPDDRVQWLAQSLKIGHVVDLRSEITVDPAIWTSHGVRFLTLPTPDQHPIEPEQLKRGVSWVLSALEQDVRVLVHCQHGIGRSALLACCVLVALGHDPCQALAMTKRVRPVVSPHPDQLHALLSFACGWCREQGQSAPDASWDRLAAIAYRRSSTGCTEAGGQ